MVQPDAGAEPLLGALEAARSRVLVKMFKLTSNVILDSLISAHERGVLVQVLLNPTRSDGSRANDEAFARLARHGVRVAWTNPDFYVTHEKSVVIDDSAYVFTFNLCDKYFRKTRGYAVATRDPQEVAEIAEGFACDWDRRSFTPGNLAWSQGREGNSRSQLLEIIDGAQYSLDIQHPKLVDAVVLERLLMAVARGVRVRFLSSGKKGISAYDADENAVSMWVLIRLGAKIHKIKRPRVHAKLVVADRCRALVGSMNLDRSCFELRRELGLMLTHPAPVTQLLAVFERDWTLSVAFEEPDLSSD